MNMPSDWNDTQRQTQFGGARKLPADGYVCRIIKVQDTESQSHKPMLKIMMDIHEGEYKGFFKNKYESRVKYNPDKEVKWPCVGMVMKQTDEGATNGAFKNFIMCVQESNPGWNPQWNESFEACFKNKLVGAVFIEEEFETQDGRIASNTKPDFGHFKSIADIRKGAGVGYEIPQPKLLDKQSRNTPQNSGGIPEEELPDGFMMVDETEIPF